MPKKYIFLGIAAGILLFIPAVTVSALTEADCGPGYTWDRMSGVGCKQTNCNSIGDAHYSYTGHCICGSSGSVNEDPTDPNKECYKGSDNAGCKGCLYACVGLDEDCPGETGTTTNTNTSTNTNSSVNTNQTTNANANANQNSNASSNQNVNISQSGINISLSTSGTTTGPTCTDKCNKYLRGHKNAVVLEATGTYPKCQCVIDVKDDLNRLTQTIRINGDDQTTYHFDPESGQMTRRTMFNRREEIERIRVRLGYRYTQEEIDKLLAPDKVDAWFNNQIKNIDTRTGLLDPQFWWQHFVAILDHGFDGSDANFVDVNNYGRCGDSMQWLERNVLSHLGIGSDPDKPGQKHEGILSITGEKYSNLLNHTAIMIRPQGIPNQEWNDMVKELKKQSGGQKSNPGIEPDKLKNIDPRLLDAKVIDPYKKEITTVREFIKGWSYIRIS